MHPQEGEFMFVCTDNISQCSAQDAKQEMSYFAARFLSSLTQDFYAQLAASFSDTRQGAWPGWERVLHVCSQVCKPSMSVLDVACGNLRFERYLFDHIELGAVYAYDTSQELVKHSNSSDAPWLHFRELDIAESLLRKNTTSLFDVSCVDMAVCFAFMHHLPLLEQRVRLLQALVATVRPGGFICISFWQFANNDALRIKAEKQTKQALAALQSTELKLGENDYLLGWQDTQNLYRYCHHFDEEEIDLLMQSVAERAQEVARFSSDGRDGALNRYLVLQRTAC